MLFSLQHIPALSPYTPLQRVALLNLALRQLPGTHKVMLNLIKLMLLVPPFFLLAQLTPWLVALALLLMLVGFHLLMRPIQIAFATPYWSAAISQFEQHYRLSRRDSPHH